MRQLYAVIRQNEIFKSRAREAPCVCVSVAGCKVAPMYVAEDADDTLALVDQSTAAGLERMLDGGSRNCARCALGEPRRTADCNQVTHPTGNCIAELPKLRMM